MNMATTQTLGEANSKRPSVVSEALAEALRSDQAEEFSAASPYAACLMPLLKMLGWHNYARELVESLPHFAEQFDLIDLRNVLISLGYESAPLKTRIIDLKEELYPCLFISQSGEIYVLNKRTDYVVEYFDSRHQKNVCEDIFHLKGTAYVFTDTHPTHGVSNSGVVQGDWFANLLQRFRQMIIHLLGMTFIVNLVALAVPLFIMMIYDKVIAAKSPDTLPYLVSGVAILLLSDLVLRMLRSRLIGRVAGRLDYLIGVETFKQMILLPPLFTERSTVAAQLSRLKQFDSVRNFFTGPNAAIVLELPFVVLFILVIALLAGYIALIPLVMVLAFLLLGFLWMPSLNQKILRSGKARTDKQRILIQTLNGREEIKAIGGETVWWERFREVSGEAVMSNYQTLVSTGVMSSIAQGLMTLSGLAVIAAGTASVIAGTMTIGALIATMALVWRVLSPLQSAFLSFSKFQQTLKAIQQINQLMRLKVERHTGKSGLMLANMQGYLNIERVSFRYGPDMDPALLGVSFNAQPGEMVAIVGNTGSGKSSLLKLVAGMYRPQGGSISIDSLDMRQLNAMDLRRAIAYVPQETKLFRGTIAQNMRLNNGLATDEDLFAAAREAGVYEEIMNLPEGFETRVGDSTTDRMPPGFLRSLSMARAFVSPARILLLDEPGASLDDESDRRFMEQIKQLKGKKTIIMVSHRPSHIRLADKVVLLEKGSVEFIGPADQAVEKLLEAAQ
ncbi:MAG: peptidase domain-containing ABC transporter [gamma proteobacterium endosymbiont of Lamellibrachia anaximandri]|nr:peptidase domain-containing ABC transporter [gamma proteobacterium endosymbiont of Lamellibrachia anaximandri]MBL3535600.1 peptidase domain-containing ABC transporter [gamma proteobacterium endosymbiont of Lamellibrachia anaximandri]